MSSIEIMSLPKIQRCRVVHFTHCPRKCSEVSLLPGQCHSMARGSRLLHTGTWKDANRLLPVSSQVIHLLCSPLRLPCLHQYLCFSGGVIHEIWDGAYLMKTWWQQPSALYSKFEANLIPNYQKSVFTGCGWCSSGCFSSCLPPNLILIFGLLLYEYMDYGDDL